MSDKHHGTKPELDSPATAFAVGLYISLYADGKHEDFKDKEEDKAFAKGVASIPKDIEGGIKPLREYMFMGSSLIKYHGGNINKAMHDCFSLLGKHQREHLLDSALQIIESDGRVTGSEKKFVEQMKKEISI